MKECLLVKLNDMIDIDVLVKSFSQEGPAQEYIKMRLKGVSWNQAIAETLVEPLAVEILTEMGVVDKGLMVAYQRALEKIIDDTMDEKRESNLEGRCQECCADCPFLPACIDEVFNSL